MMSVIETQIWEEIPEKKGYVRYVGQRKLVEVFNELEAYLKKEGICPEEYFLPTHDAQPDTLFPRGDIRCYAQWGGSEGIYIELEVLVGATKDSPYKIVHIATGKTLDESAAAYDRMQYIAGRIYKAFCGEGFQPSRYCIIDSGEKKEVTHERLLKKLRGECTAYMKRELLHKQTPIDDVSDKLGMMMTILSVIKKPKVYEALPKEKIEELCSTENVLDILCEMCSSVSEADSFEIEDIIASAPAFAGNDQGDEKGTNGNLSHSERIAARLECLKSKITELGGKFEHSLFDDRHLDRFWYDGKGCIKIDYKGYTVSFDVIGDVQATIVCDKGINEEGFVEISHYSGEQPLYYNEALKAVMEDDTALELYRQIRGTEIESENRISVSIVNTTDPNIPRQVDTKATVGQKEVTGSNATYFLAFFDNGANVNWSVPREWIYDLFVPVFSHEVETGSDLYNKFMDAAGNANLADRTYTDPDTNKVYYYQANNKQIYRLYNRLVSSDDNTLTSGGAMSGQTQTSLNGFKFETRTQYEKFQNSDTDDGRDSFTMRFFYTRDDFAITLHSHGEVFDSDTLEFDSEIDDFMTDGNGNLREPPYPDTLEENAYYFDGWYASPECVDGTQYVAGSGYKMPAVDFALYAKWAPKTHTVRFFQTHDDLLRYEADNNGISGLLYTYEVKHGQVLGSVNNPTDKSEYHYSFGGWFYDYVGKRYAYTPLDVPVIRDLNVFAAWGSLTAQPYRIHYALDNPETADEWTELLAAVASTAADNATYTVTNGTEMRTYVYLKSDGKFHLCIADDTEGFAYQGSTRTFSPKVGDPYNQLHEAYNKGYYPTFASHSITMEYEENKEEPQNNVFTFTYVYKETVDYRVEYRYADTGVLINTVAQGGIAYKSTGDGVVTERFVAVPDYIPDAFFKRLILAVEKDEDGKYVSASTNVIIFYYTKNTTSAYYAVHYMLQNLGAGTEKTYQNGKYINYTESSAYTEGIGTIGQECAIPPQAFSGFTVEDTALINGSTETALTTNASGKRSFNITVSSNGTELYIFYTRNMQEYSVYYLQYGTDISDLKSLQYTDGSNGVLHETKAGQAQFGDTVTESAADVSIGGMTCISALSQSILIRSNNDQNYIIFYYTPVQTTIEYRVWQYGGGALSKTLEVFDAKAGEIEGSTALAMDGYTFEGWYLDEACTLPASTKGTVNGTHLLPNSNLLDVMPQVNVFYAKFLPDNGSLTVVRENGEGDESNGKQVFVYKIQAVSDPDYVLYVTIVGNGSVTIKDLPCREYTVTQQNDWSWRYDDAEQNVTVENEGSTVTFDEAAVKTTWLNGNSRRISNRKG